MAEVILAEALASKSLLQAMAGRPVFRKVSATEKTKLVSHLKGSKLSSTDMASILKVIFSSGFADEDQNELIDAIGGCVSAPAMSLAKVQRTSLQSWESLGHFIPSSIWTKLSEGSLDSFLAFLIKMGLRYPTEPTVATITLFSLHQSDSEGLATMSPETRLAHVRACKQAFKSRCKFEGPPEVFIEKLQPSCEGFAKSYPNLFAELYSAEGPAPCPLTELALAQLRVGTRVRGGRGLSSTALGKASNGVEMMMQFGQAMMQQMTLMNKEIAQMRSGSVSLNFLPRHRAALPPPPLPALADAPRHIEETVESDGEKVETPPPVTTPPTKKTTSYCGCSD